MTTTIASVSQANEKPTNDELMGRIETVRDLFIRGARRQEIVRYASVKTGWGVTARTVDKYIRRAKILISKEHNLRRELALGFGSEAFREIYSRALADKNYTEARLAIRDFLAVHQISLEDAADRDGGPDDDQNRIAILVAPERLSHEQWDAKHGKHDQGLSVLVGPEGPLTHEEWDARHGTTRIPALTPEQLRHAKYSPGFGVRVPPAIPALEASPLLTTKPKAPGE